LEKRVIIFVVFCFAVLLGWGWLQDRLFPKPPAKPKPAASAPAASPASPSSLKPGEAPQAGASAPLDKPADKESKEQRVSIKTDKLQVELSTRGARVTSWQLLPFREHQDDPQPVELVPISPTALALRGEMGCLEIPGAYLEARTWDLETPKPQAFEGGWRVAFKAQVKELGLSVRKVFEFRPGAFDAKVKIEVSDLSGKPRSLDRVALVLGPSLGQFNPKDTYNQVRSAVMTDQGISRESSKAQELKKSYDGRALWVALRNHYFAAAWLPGAGGWQQGEALWHADRSISVALVAPDLSLPGKGTLALDATLYGGPQDYSLMEAYGSRFNKVVDFGWMSILAVPMMRLLQWLYLITRNYGLAIILLTALVKALLWVPTHKGMTSMRHFQKAQAQMQPRLETLKKVYKSDPKKLNEETMKLYQEMGVNPVAGCLPMLVQIPIFIALYSSLNNSFELRGAPFFLIWKDLSAGDPTYVLPLLMGVSMWLQQRMTPTVNTTPEAAQQQKIMLWMMPIMLAGMAIWFSWPVGLLIYMAVQNTLGIAQQAYINKTVA
jgi:YidC/Oxa1 family membrane protein insertase